MSTVAELEARIAQLEVLKIGPAVGPNTSVTPLPVAAAAPPLKLDLGCGKNKKEGFLGVDVLDLPGVDVKLCLAERTHSDNGTWKYKPWPWADSSVDEVHCSHTVEHFQFNPEHPERIHFVNELWRILKPGAKATITVPHWNSCRQYGDYTHREPVSEFWPPYLNKVWREGNAPHDTIYTCDFDCTQPGYTLHPSLTVRSVEYQQYALGWFREAAQDMIFTLVAKK